MIKRFSKGLLLVLALIIAFITPKVFAEDTVYVEDITLVGHSSYAIEKSAPTKNGLNIGFDLSFSQVDDFAKYKIVVNNPTDTSYELNRDIDFRSSDYLEYKVEFEGDNNIINAGQKLNLYITITYKTAVPSSMLTDGKLVENNSLSLNLSNETGDTVVNPSTIDRVVLYAITLIITSFFSIAFYIITKNKKYLSIFVLGLLLIPFEAYALEKLEFKIDTKVVIEEKFYVNYVYGTAINPDEKDDYELVETDPCSPIKNSEYEYCYVIYTDPVLYAKGEDVTFLESIDSKYVNEQGELSTQTIITDNLNHIIYEIEIDHLNQNSFIEGDTRSFWKYYVNNDTNNPDDSYLNIFSDVSVIYHDADPGNPTYELVEVKTPSTFKMQNHDMYFYLGFPIR